MQSSVPSRVFETLDGCEVGVSELQVTAAADNLKGINVIDKYRLLILMGNKIYGC